MALMLCVFQVVMNALTTCPEFFSISVAGVSIRFSLFDA